MSRTLTPNRIKGLRMTRTLKIELVPPVKTQKGEFTKGHWGISASYSNGNKYTGIGVNRSCEMTDIEINKALQELVDQYIAEHTPTLIKNT